MSTRYVAAKQELQETPRRWLVTGVAGFIGSALLEQLLTLDQRVVGLDNFLTGHPRNLEDVRRRVTAEQWKRFEFREGDIRDLAACREACGAVDVVLHQAALGSVPRSMTDPVTTNTCNVDGFLNMLVAARDAKCTRFVFAASSSTYGDSPTLPKKEDVIGRPLSPYAVTKYVNELYAEVFSRCYGMSTIGLRYFNVFGRRQDPEGAYAAVIPRWFASLLRNETVFINGDGETSRDFCHVDNAVQANLLAGLANSDAGGRVYNVAVGERTTLNQLFEMIRVEVSGSGVHEGAEAQTPQYRAFREGDVRHSLADISLAQSLLGYAPTLDVRAGLKEASHWYRASIR